MSVVVVVRKSDVEDTSAMEDVWKENEGVGISSGGEDGVGDSKTDVVSGTKLEESVRVVLGLRLVDSEMLDDTDGVLTVMVLTDDVIPMMREVED